MIIRIQTRSDDGKYVDANASDFALAAFDRIESWGNWSWLIEKLGIFCLARAEKVSHQHANADLWIARYQALRSIK